MDSPYLFKKLVLRCTLHLTRATIQYRLANLLLQSLPIIANLNKHLQCQKDYFKYLKL